MAITEESGLPMAALYPIRRAGKFGYVNLHGDIVVPPKFRYAGDFNEGLGYCHDFDGTVSIINADGQIVGTIDDVDDVAPFFSGGHVVFQRGEAHGVADAHGNVVVEPQFDLVVGIVNGKCIVKRGDLYGIYSVENRWHIQPNYALIYVFEEGSDITSATSTTDDLSLIISLEGQVLSNKRFRSAWMYKEKLIPVQFDDVIGGCGWVDAEGETVVGGMFDDVNDRFCGGTIGVRRDSQWGIADKTGNLLLEYKYSMISTESEGLRKYCDGAEYLVAGEFRGGLWGFLDLNGNVVIEAKYSGVQSFHSGGAIAYMKDGRHRNYVVIDKKGNQVCKWDYQ